MAVYRIPNLYIDLHWIQKYFLRLQGSQALDGYQHLKSWHAPARLHIGLKMIEDQMTYSHHLYWVLIHFISTPTWHRQWTVPRNLHVHLHSLPLIPSSWWYSHSQNQMHWLYQDSDISHPKNWSCSQSKIHIILVAFLQDWKRVMLLVEWRCPWIIHVFQPHLDFVNISYSGLGIIEPFGIGYSEQNLDLVGNWA